ncbi:MAG: hypothetical protein EPN43_00380 [Jatrophihabitans sp.]|nr:MAG: hypothetical protein EPN43_00380 [Jatrophihabitans sp.]
MAEYRDPLITADADGVTVRRYYFPTTNAKHIRWASIQAVSRQSMTGLSGRYRIWGSGDLRRYFNLDTRRPKKDTAFEFDLGGWFRPVLTPDDPDAFAAVLAEHDLT